MAPDTVAGNDSSVALATIKTTRGEPATLKFNLVDQHSYLSFPEELGSLVPK
jgi:hypothetical protein